MEPSTPRVLLLERVGSDAIQVDQVRAALGGQASVDRAANRADFAVAAANEPDVILAAVDLAAFSAAEALAWLNANGVRTPVVLLSDDDCLPEALRLVRAGAADVVLRRDRWRLSVTLPRLLQAPTPDTTLRALVEQCADGLLVLDEQGRITWMNATAERMYGLTDTRTTGLDARMILPMDWRSYADGPARELVARRADGTTVPLELTLRRAAVGRMDLLLGTLRDLSERTSLEAQLQRAQRSEAIATLATGVAHEFNNILTGILTYASLLQRDLGEDHPSHADVVAIELAGERAAGLVRRLLALSRRQPSTPSRVDLNRVVADSATFLRRVIGGNIELTVVAAPTLASVWADADQVQQVLTNLVINARDAMPQGGEIALLTRLTRVTDAPLGLPPVQPGAYAAIEVRDTGIGMDAPTLARSFDPIAATRSGGPSRGLGLPVVQGILRQHGGFMAVESEPGRGTRVTVYFPVDTPGLPSEAAGVGAVVNRGHEVILLAEDDDTVRDVVERILASHGYTVHSTRDGDDALAMFRSDPSRFDAAVLDVLMPRLGGLDTAVALRKVQPALRVLWVSGFAAGSRVTPDAQTDFLPKPFTPDELVRRLRALLDRPERG